MITSFEAAQPLQHKDLADYGFARVRDQAYDAVCQLWRRRQAEGMKQKDIAEILSRDEGWVSRNLRGPGNWTLRTFGELVSALRGEAEIIVFALEDQPSQPRNFNAYDGYGTREGAGPIQSFVFDGRNLGPENRQSGGTPFFEIIAKHG